MNVHIASKPFANTPRSAPHVRRIAHTRRFDPRRIVRTFSAGVSRWSVRHRPCRDAPQNRTVSTPRSRTCHTPIVAAEPRGAELPGCCYVLRCYCHWRRCYYYCWRSRQMGAEAARNNPVQHTTYGGHPWRGPGEARGVGACDMRVRVVQIRK